MPMITPCLKQDSGTFLGSSGHINAGQRRGLKGPGLTGALGAGGARGAGAGGGCLGGTGGIGHPGIISRLGHSVEHCVHAVCVGWLKQRYGTPRTLEHWTPGHRLYVSSMHPASSVLK